MDSPWLSEISIYPVKSLGGISLQEAEVTPEGLQFDRRWMLVDEENNFMTQRNFPGMTKIATEISGNALHLSERKNPANRISIPLIGEEKKISVKVWENQVDATEEIQESSQWLSDFLNRKCKLVKMASFSQRLTDDRYAPGHQTGFADGYPVLVVNESSLDFLNQQLETPVEMKRFRPNLVVKGLNAFEEDTIRFFSFGNVDFQCVKPCGRCVLINISPETGEQGLEPLRTLSRFRTENHKVLFGQNAVVLSTGKLIAGLPMIINQNNP